MEIQSPDMMPDPLHDDSSLAPVRAIMNALVVFGSLIFLGQMFGVVEIARWSVPTYWLSISILVYFCLFKGLSVEKIVQAKPVSWKWIGVACVGVVAYQIMGVSLINFLNLEPPQKAPVNEGFELFPVASSIMALLAPLWEELYFRGIIYPSFEHWFRKIKGSRWIAILLTSAWFALIHGPQTNFWLPALFMVGGVGLLFAVFRSYSGSVLPGIAAHLAYNTILIAEHWLVAS